MTTSLQRFARAGGASTVQQVVTIGTQLASVPILLSAWGVPTYGAWLVLSAIPTYLSLSDFGFGTAASNQMAMRYAKNDISGANQSFRITITLALSSAAILGALILFIVNTIPLSIIPGRQTLGDREARIVLIALSFGTLFIMLRAAFYSVLYADGRYPVGIVLLSASRGLEFASLATAALLGAGPAGCGLAVLVTSLILTVAYGLFVILSSPWISKNEFGVRWTDARELAAPSLSYLLFPLSNALNIQGFLLAIGATSSPQTVVLFSTLRTISRLAVMPLRSVLEAIRPEISRSFGLEQFDHLRRMLHAFTWAASWLALAIAGTLCLAAEPLVRGWTSGNVSVDWPTLLLLVAASTVQAASYPSFMVLNGSNSHRALATFYLVANTLGVVACLLTPPNYTPAPAAILLMVEIAIGAMALNQASSLLGTPPWMTLRSAVLPRREDLALSQAAFARFAHFLRR